jgi:hypothetical protein
MKYMGGTYRSALFFCRLQIPEILESEINEEFRK